MPTHLDESNILRLLPEALTADVQAIFADETSGVCADAATKQKVVSHHSIKSWAPMPKGHSFNRNTGSLEDCERTIDEIPFRRCEGASTRPIRET